MCVSSLCVWSAYGKKAFGIEHPFSFFSFFFWLFFSLYERVSFNIFLHVPALDATSKELPNIAKKTAKKESKWEAGEVVKYTKKIRNARAKNVK